MGRRLILLHGRKSPTEEMDDWGFDGPILLGVEALHVTYFTTFNLFFTSKRSMLRAQELTGWEKWDSNALSMKFTDGLVVTKDGYFGDWEIQNNKWKKKS